MNTPNNTNARSKAIDNLRLAVVAYADIVLPPANNPDYRATLLDFFGTEGTSFLTEAIDKFADGQLHYGGNFFTIDSAVESRAEHLDLFNYNAKDRYVAKNPSAADIHEPK